MAELVSCARRRLPRSLAVALVGAAVIAWLAVSVRQGTRFDADATLTRLVAGDSHWTNERAALEAFESLREDPSVCGVALAGVPWYLTPGYASLHRDVPIFLIRSEAEVTARLQNVNAWLADIRVMRGFAPARAQRCWPGGLCLFRRTGTCSVIPGYSVNRVLVELDE